MIGQWEEHASKPRPTELRPQRLIPVTNMIVVFVEWSSFSVIVLMLFAALVLVSDFGFLDLGVNGTPRFSGK